MAGTSVERNQGHCEQTWKQLLTHLTVNQQIQSLFQGHETWPKSKAGLKCGGTVAMDTCKDTTAAG